MIVIQDTREKTGWDFFVQDEVECVAQIKLDEGDYTTAEILHLEKETGRKILRIERKASPSELAANISQKRFIRELERLSEYEFPYLIFEFDQDEMWSFPKNLHPKLLYKTDKKGRFILNRQGKKIRQVRMNGPYMMSIIERWREDYNLLIIFAGSQQQAKEKAIEVMNADFRKI